MFSFCVILYIYCVTQFLMIYQVLLFLLLKIKQHFVPRPQQKTCLWHKWSIHEPTYFRSLRNIQHNSPSWKLHVHLGRIEKDVSFTFRISVWILKSKNRQIFEIFTINNIVPSRMLHIHLGRTEKTRVQDEF